MKLLNTKIWDILEGRRDVVGWQAKRRVIWFWMSLSFPIFFCQCFNAGVEIEIDFVLISSPVTVQQPPPLCVSVYVCYTQHLFY